MISKSLIKGVLFFLCTVLFYSCSDEKIQEAEQQVNEADAINLSEELGLDSGEAKIFTMPTPLQIASALEIMGVNYNHTLLLKHNEVKSTNDVNLSLALGMYMVDLGYCTVYNNPQKALDYAKDVQVIMEELPIAYYVNDAFAKRFKNNQTNRDSLCKIILQGYNDANQYITETENEGIGLLILTGAYIEGFYLVVNSQVKESWRNEYTSMIIQQKQFIDNFLTLLAPYKVDAEIKEVYSLLTDLNTVFEGVNIRFNDVKQSYELDSQLSFQQQQLMKRKVIEVRKNLVEKSK